VTAGSRAPTRFAAVWAHAAAVFRARLRANRLSLLADRALPPYVTTMRLTGFSAAMLAACICQPGWSAEALATVPAAVPAGATPARPVASVDPKPADTPKPADPKTNATGRVWSPVPIGRYGDWQAATHQENGQTVCYALTYATSSQPLFQGRGHVVLTVAMRPRDRDAVAILLGYSVLPHAGASVQAGGKRLHFYLEGRSAFAPHGHEAVEALAAGKQAIGSFPGPRGLTLRDVFSLNGFAAAYAAIVKACP
jgi:hypothetical protein